MTDISVSDSFPVVTIDACPFDVVSHARSNNADDGANEQISPFPPQIWESAGQQQTKKFCSNEVME